MRLPGGQSARAGRATAAHRPAPGADQRSLEESQRLGVYIVEQALSRLDAEHDSILGIFDMRAFSWANADFAFVEFLVSALACCLAVWPATQASWRREWPLTQVDLFFDYYPRRLSQVLVVDAPWVFRPAWTVVRPMLRKYALLVRFVSRQELRAEFFDETTLPDCLR